MRHYADYFGYMYLPLWASASITLVEHNYTFQQMGPVVGTVGCRNE